MTTTLRTSKLVTYRVIKPTDERTSKLVSYLTLSQIDARVSKLVSYQLLKPPVTAVSLTNANWVNLSSLPGSAFGLSSIAYGNGIWVALVGNFSSTTQRYTSTDGLNWTSRATMSGGNAGTMCFGNGKFFIAGIGEFTSTDGLSWSSVSYPAGLGTARGIFGLWNGDILSISKAGTHAGITHDGGTTWTVVTPPSAFTSATWTAVPIAYGNSVYVAVSDGASTTYGTSTDGITWTARTAPAAFQALTFVAISGVFVATSGAGSISGNGHVYTSADGITWTLVGSALHTVVQSGGIGLTYGNGVLMTTGGQPSSGSAPTYLSVDVGGTWIYKAGASGFRPTTNSPIATDGLRYFVAVGMSGGAYFDTQADQFPTVLTVTAGTTTDFQTMVARNAVATFSGITDTSFPTSTSAFASFTIIGSSSTSFPSAIGHEAVATFSGDSTADFQISNRFASVAIAGVGAANFATASAALTYFTMAAGAVPALVGQATSTAAFTIAGTGALDARASSLPTIWTASGGSTSMFLTAAVIPLASAVMFGDGGTLTNFVTKTSESFTSFTIVGSSSFTSAASRTAFALLSGSSSTSFVGSHTGTAYIGTGGTTGATTSDPTMVFYTAQLAIVPAQVASTIVVSIEAGHGVDPHGALTQVELDFPDQATQQLYFSDVGYRTAPTDTAPALPYPPLIAEAFAIDRALNLAPENNAAIAAAWGTLNIANVSAVFDSYVDNFLNTGQPLSISRGYKRYENFVGTRAGCQARGIFLDPPQTSDQFKLLFAGYQQTWSLNETTLSIPMRDASVWMDLPVQQKLYTGAGGYNGTASLAGVPIPLARGGTTAHPIRNVSPQLLDPVHLIYAYNDCGGNVVNLYEGAATTITRGADTTDLYSGSTSAGTFRTDNSRGLFQLGSTPAAAITCDVIGYFYPAAAVYSNLFDLVLHMLPLDVLLPSISYNSANIAAASTAYPYVAGIYIAPADRATGLDAISRLVSSVGGNLYPSRSGDLKVMVLRAPLGTPVAKFDTSNAVSLVAASLPSSIDPPPYRIRVGHNHNYTQMSSGFLGAATAAQQQFVAQTDTYAGTVSADVQTNYARPNDLAPLQTCLLNGTDAQSVASDLMALWGVRRRLYTLSVPVDLGLARDLGDVIQITWPIDNLRAGQIGIIVGESFRSSDSVINFSVLV